MILIEMILLWFTLLTTVIMIATLHSGHEQAAVWTLIAVSFITIYVTLMIHQPVIKDSVVFG